MLGFLTPAVAFHSRQATGEVIGGQLGEITSSPDREVSEATVLETSRLAREAVSPLARMEHALHPWSAYAILPLFALANAGVPVLCAVLYALGLSEAFSAAYVAAIGAALADTAESEVGQLSRHAPRLLTSLRRVPPGTDGAVSLPGTLAGVAAAGLTAGLGLALGLVWGWGTAGLVALAAFLGTGADSLVGARLPRLGNEATNVACTLVAAALALVFHFFIR